MPQNTLSASSGKVFSTVRKKQNQGRIYTKLNPTRNSYWISTFKNPVSGSQRPKLTGKSAHRVHYHGPDRAWRQWLTRAKLNHVSGNAELRLCPSCDGGNTGT
jgi:hypothetical protein